MTYQDAIADAAGARSPLAVGRFLDDYLLPGEPVLAAVRGAIRSAPAWVVVTPGVVVVLRESADGTVAAEAAATPWSGIAWNAEESRGDHRLHLHLGGTELTIGQVTGRRLTPFLAAADEVMASLDGGFPPRVAGVLRNLEATRDRATRARHAEPDRVPRVPGPDLFHAVAGAVTHQQELSYYLGLVLTATDDPGPGPDPRPGRRELVLSAVDTDHRTAVEDYAAVRSLRDAEAGDGDDEAWREVVTALARAVSGAASLLGPDSVAARATMQATAEGLLEVAVAPARRAAAAPAPTPVLTPAPTPPAAAAGDRLLDTLERLQRLHGSGALTDAEYDTLKQGALRA